METKIYKKISEAELKILGELLQNNELVAIPTETVYGLGGNGLSEVAIQKIFQAKGRPSDNPLILHIESKERVYELAQQIPPLAEKLMDLFWPGPLTLILPKADKVPYVVTGGLDTVAVRCPNHKICLEILKAAKVPIAAPSANISGKPSPTTAEAVVGDMNGKISAIVDAGACEIGLESTVVECLHDEIVILRPGKITEDMLKELGVPVRYDEGIKNQNIAPKAPGMKYKHYAPQAPLFVFVGTVEKVRAAFLEKLKELKGKHSQDKLRIGLFFSEEVSLFLEKYLHEKNDFEIVVFGKSQDITNQSKCFYDSLLHFDKKSVDYILAEGTLDLGLGKALLNRMEKASGHHVFYV